MGTAYSAGSAPGPDRLPERSTFLLWCPEAVFPGMRAPIGWFRGHIHSMYSYLSAVNKKKAFTPSFADGAYVNRVMEAAYKSDKTGLEEHV